MRLEVEPEKTSNSLAKRLPIVVIGREIQKHGIKRLKSDWKSESVGKIVRRHRWFFVISSRTCQHDFWFPLKHDFGFHPKTPHMRGIINTLQINGDRIFSFLNSCSEFIFKSTSTSSRSSSRNLRY
jgi:hypothetical protein